ncbi:ATP-binding cassette domain-containing protein [Streptomyces sp. NPDC059009]|uniref:ABC transporter ATP-binding protein n=1 Tax=Streptomyces sp. NPDC059009 TaxID=3346694 RepID=UPI00367CB4E3
MIQAIGLTSNARKDLPPAVDDVSFEARTGRVTALLGAHGAGKTTTLRLMLELQQGRGITYFRGRPLHRIAHPCREVGVLLGEVPGHPARTVRGQLRMLCAAAGVPVRRADDVLEVVGLVSLRDQRLGMLSRGMDRRLGLACALLSDPHTLVLDGPADGLSVRESRWLHGILRAHASHGGTVLFSTGDAKEAARTADRVITLEAGRLVADQEAADFARTRLRPRVAVRSPYAGRLAALLTKEARTGQRSIEVVREDGNRLAVYGSSCADVGETAFRHGILVHQLADEIGDAGPLAPPTPTAEAPGSARPEAAPAETTPSATHEPEPDPATSSAPASAISSPPASATSSAPKPAPTTDPKPGLTADPEPEPSPPPAQLPYIKLQSTPLRPTPLQSTPENPATGHPLPPTDPQHDTTRQPTPTTMVPLATDIATRNPLTTETPQPSPASLSPLPPPITIRSARSPLRPFRYELRRAFGVGTGYLTSAAVLALSAVLCVFLGRTGHSPQHRLLAAWPQELPLPPAALGAGLLGALAFGDEFRHPSLAADRGTVPRRLGLLVAKLTVAAATGLLLALLTVASDGTLLHLVYGDELTKVPADWLSLSASWAALVMGCAWAGVLAAGVFRSTTAGLAAVLAVPIVVVPLVQKALEGPSVRSAAGFPARLRDLALVQWPFGAERYVAGGVRVLAQPVGSALMLSLTALLCAYLLTAMRGRAR